MSDDVVQDAISEHDVAVEDPTTVAEHYQRLRLLVESMESDLLKNSRGNKTAGTRLRKSLRLLKSYSGEFVKFSVEADKAWFAKDFFNCFFFYLANSHSSYSK